MLGLRRMRSPQKIASVHASARNRFDAGCTFSGRSRYEQARVAAPAGWLPTPDP